MWCVSASGRDLASRCHATLRSCTEIMSAPDTEFISILGASGSPEAPSRVSARSLPEVLPILGLSDIVIFPGMVAPLLVETGPSTKIIDDVVGDERFLGGALQRNAEADNPMPHEMHEVGC